VIRAGALLGAALTALGLAAGVYAPDAAALPGQCVYSPFGGFCDGAAAVDGSFNHCENGGYGGFTYSRCFQACHDPVTNTAVPTDLDPRTVC
jgi:hypothetical protein